MSEQSITHEANGVVPNILGPLKELRWQLACEQTEKQMERVLSDIDLLGRPNPDFLSTAVGSGQEIKNDFTAGERIALQGIGIDANKVIGHRSQLAGTVNETDCGYKAKQGRFTAYVNDYETGYRFLGDSDDRTDFQAFASEIAPLLQTEFGTYDVFQKIHAKQPSESGKAPNELTISQIDTRKDAQAVIAILERLGVSLGQVYKRDQIIADDEWPEIVEKALHEGYGDSLMRTETDDFIKISWSETIGRRVFYDKHTKEMSVTLSQRPEELYVESANMANVVKGEPFVDTQCAKELTELASEQGLMLAPWLQAAIVKTGQPDQYGGVYTQMTREIGKWINSPHLTRTLKLFVPFNKDFAATNRVSETGADSILTYVESTGDNPASDREAIVRDAIMQMDTGALSTPTQVLIDMMKGALSRSGKTDLPVSHTVLKQYKLNVCFDVTTAFLDSAVQPLNRDGLTMITTDEKVRMIQKRKDEKQHTWLLTEPTWLNGVLLPKGSLMARADASGGHPEGDGGWLFMRLTPYTFDEPKDVRVFGTEAGKAQLIHSRALAALGGMTLSHIAERAAYRTSYGAR